jgi:hypothetical protein
MSCSVQVSQEITLLHPYKQGLKAWALLLTPLPLMTKALSISINERQYKRGTTAVRPIFILKYNGFCCNIVG